MTLIDQEHELTSYLIDDFDLAALACDHRTNSHNFIDTNGAGALFCLCGEHEWSSVPSSVKAYYYPATLVNAEEQSDA